MPQRQVFHSSPSGDGWKVTQSGRTISNHATQASAEDEAIRLAKKAESDGGLGQAVLHKSDGKIREERTYGKDPKRTPG